MGEQCHAGTTKIPKFQKLVTFLLHGATRRQNSNFRKESPVNESHIRKYFIMPTKGLDGLNWRKNWG